jgi:hypothetical protein
MQPAEKIIREYLSSLVQITSGKQRSYFQWLLKHGKFYHPGQRLPLAGRDLDCFKAKQCFFNAQTLACEDPDLLYVEGFYVTEGLPIPIDHGWNVDRKSGYLLDVTAHVAGLTVEGWFGVPVPTAYIQQQHDTRQIAMEYLPSYFKDYIVQAA